MIVIYESSVLCAQQPICTPASPAASSEAPCATLLLFLPFSVFVQFLKHRMGTHEEARLLDSKLLYEAKLLARLFAQPCKRLHLRLQLHKFSVGLIYPLFTCRHGLRVGQSLALFLHEQSSSSLYKAWPCLHARNSLFSKDIFFFMINTVHPIFVFSEPPFSSRLSLCSDNK